MGLAAVLLGAALPGCDDGHDGRVCYDKEEDFLAYVQECESKIQTAACVPWGIFAMDGGPPDYIDLKYPLPKGQFVCAALWHANVSTCTIEDCASVDACDLAANECQGLNRILGSFVFEDAAAYWASP